MASCQDEYSCLAMRLPEMERQALEAIRTLHGQLDDDANGNIDISESEEVRIIWGVASAPYQFLSFSTLVYVGARQLL